METKVLSVMIYEALNAKGAGLGNASIGIIESAIDEYEAAQQSVQRTGNRLCDCDVDPSVNRLDGICLLCGLPRR
jgi:hypothetical protein